MGDAHAGVRVRLVGPSPNFDSAQHLLSEEDLPHGWHNGGLGGVRVGADATMVAYGGARTMHAGETLSFKFELLLTPCKPIDSATHWGQRYFQVGVRWGVRVGWSHGV
jgi:hypothetical protein